MRRIFEDITDFLKEHKVITAVSGLILVLVILIAVLSCMSGGAAPLVESPDSKYPYSISVTAKGLELTVTGEFPKGYSWEGESANGDIITLSKTASTGKKVTFLIGPRATGSALIRFYLQKAFIPEMPDELHEISIQVYVDENGEVTLASYEDSELKGLLGDDTDTFSYRVGEKTDGTLLVWIDNSKLKTTWTAYPSGSNVKVAEREEEPLTQTEVMAQGAATEEELAREAQEIADADIRNQYEDGIVPEELRYNSDETKENQEIDLSEIPDQYLYIVSYVKDGSTTVQFRPDSGENNGFIFSVMATVDGKVAVTEAHVYGQKILTDIEGNPITDAEGNSIYIGESTKSGSLDTGNASILPGSSTIQYIPSSLQSGDTSVDYYSVTESEEEIPIKVQKLSYTDSFGREWTLIFTPYAVEEELVGEQTIAVATWYDDVSAHGYSLGGKASAIWEWNYMIYLLQATEEDATVSDAMDQAQSLIVELNEAE